MSKMRSQVRAGWASRDRCLAAGRWVAVDDGEKRDDASLVRAAQAGDHEAFTLLFRRHYGAVRRVCARRLASESDADEMAQAAFVRAYERIARCGGDRRFGAWVQVIALRLCGDAWRAQARVTPVAEPDPAAPSGAADVCLDAVLRRERAVAVRGALATLPARQRDVIVARYVEGRRPRDVAATLAVSVGAVDSLLLRARRRLALACEASGIEHGAASTSVATTSLVAGSAVADGRSLVRPLAHLGGSLAGVLDAVGAGVSSALGLGPAAPTVAQRAVGLVGAGALLLAPLAGAVQPAQPPSVVQPAPAAPGAPGVRAGVVADALELPGRLAGGLPALSVPSVAVPPVALPPLTVPPATAFALPAPPALPGVTVGPSGTPPAPVAGAAGEPLSTVLDDAAGLTIPAAAVAKVASTLTDAAGEVTMVVGSTLHGLAGGLGVLLAPEPAPPATAR